MSGRGRLARAAGEGALAGCAAGSAFAAWELFVTRDLAHGLHRLAAERAAADVAGGALAGAVLSAASFLLLERLRRLGARPLRIGVTLLFLGYGAGVLLAAFPLRDTFFHLRRFSTHSLFLTVFVAQVAVAGFLLWRRCRELFGGAVLNGREQARPAAAIAGTLVLLAGGVAVIAIPRWPIAAGVSGHPVILVSLDTLRADRVGFLGNGRGLTPHLDTLAREGAVFEQAHAPAPWTLPSHASVFLSLLPFDHGCRWDHKAIQPRYPTLAERFRNAGYRTAGFTGGGYVSATFGFDHGFERYEEHNELEEGGPERIVTAARRWILAHRSEPFFVFVHTYEVHFPFDRRELARPQDAGRLPTVIGDAELKPIRTGSLVLTPEERRYIADLYDGGVARADRVVGKFLEDLRHEGILDRAVLMVISDHGEELWERTATRSPGHGHSLYQELQHVPWLVRAPGIVRAGLRLRQPVGLLDLSPTLQDLVGLPADPAQQGASLTDSLRSGNEPDLRPIYMESVEYGPDRFALREGAHKVVLAPLPERFNLGVALVVPPLQVFDLVADPGEQTDLSQHLDDESRRRVQELYDRVQRVFRPLSEEQGEADLPDDLRQVLESLGYIR